MLKSVEGVNVLVEALASGESDADPNIAYGYKLTDCKKNGTVVGARCSQSQPGDECKYSSGWGKCD